MMKSKLGTGALLVALAASTGALAQKQPAQGEKADAQNAPAPTPDERLVAPARGTRPRSVTPEVPPADDAKGDAQGQGEEEASAVIPYYNNFFSQYRLGPEDVISIDVFDQPRYSKANITIPPDGKIAYYFAPKGVAVVGRTTQQVADEITKHLEEYINEPKVTVTLEKAQSYRYAVLGEVGQPGMRLMTRRLTVYEALMEAGGVLGTGNKKKVTLVRHTADRSLAPRTIDIAAIERGKSRDDTYLEPGDQIFVPGNRMKTVNQILQLLPVINFARIFTGGF